MEFVITPAAQEYIRKKGDGVITVKLEKKETGCSCCGTTAIDSPSVRLGAPQAEASNYQQLSITDVILYVHSSLQSIAPNASPKIDVERTLFGRKLVLYGLTGK